ncbi:SGNH/GDSL hydrolase family protein [Luteibacter aegosomatis]|uniref:SGNH/GDSL hydrolase family protein n=1 Tax=Luteibacter aegosomatis TaxID=2911537 RepID=UPI001FF904A7|nr:SGNH/GDSL hydrolase family protein [Luteibacter aegosomatis]UPG85440.1 SGNH/GDSL hydrolase family protein [Luteibacter aegosomatis]
MRRFIRFSTLARTVFGAAALFHGTGALGSETTTGLRCHYRLRDDPSGAATTFAMPNYKVKGYWRSSSILPSRSLFFTDDRPQNLLDACRRYLATLSQVGEFVGMTAATSSQSYNYEFWYNGDLKPGAPIERIVSFGDSLSDTGNMHNESQWQLPSGAWYAGRFSNGPVWVEHLARRNGLTLHNWAIGGAQTRDVYFGLIHGVDRQVDGFFNYMQSARDYDISRTLFTFLAAGNDFVNDTKTAPEILEQQEKTLRKLAERGARKILLVNLPDVSVAPVFRMGRTDGAAVLGKVEYYNAHLGEMARRVAAMTGAEIRVVDVRSSFDEVMAHPERYGFTNATRSCLRIDADSSLNYLRKPPLRAGCSPADYVFWDSLHPTTRMHELMAGWAVASAPPSWGLH